MWLFFWFLCIVLVLLCMMCICKILLWRLSVVRKLFIIFFGKILWLIIRWCIWMIKMWFWWFFLLVVMFWIICVKVWRRLLLLIWTSRSCIFSSLSWCVFVCWIGSSFLIFGVVWIIKCLYLFMSLSYVCCLSLKLLSFGMIIIICFEIILCTSVRLVWWWKFCVFCCVCWVCVDVWWIVNSLKIVWVVFFFGWCWSCVWWCFCGVGSRR